MYRGYDDLKLILSERKILTPTHTEELHWLWSNARIGADKYPNANIFEGGTMNAVSSLFIADGIMLAIATKPEKVVSTKLISVDTYGLYDIRKNDDDCLKSYEQNQSNIDELGYSDQVSLIKGNDIEVLASLPDRSLSMAFHDSDHSEEHLTGALETGMDKMIPYALICAHDYRFDNPAVIFAVDKWHKKYSDRLTNLVIVKGICWTMVKA